MMMLANFGAAQESRRRAPRATPQSFSVAPACLPVVGVEIALSAVVVARIAVRVCLIMRRDVGSAAGCVALNILIAGV